ncbi:hypothetical protein ISCGN_010217 [Ixodes scapularis]
MALSSWTRRPTPPSADLEDTAPSPSMALNANPWLGMEKNKRGRFKAVPYSRPDDRPRVDSSYAGYAWSKSFHTIVVESLGAEKENTDPEEGASSSDLGPLSSMGSSCVADSRPWGVDCRDGSRGLFEPEVWGARPRPRGAFPCSEVDASEPASTLGLGPGATGTAPDTRLREAGAEAVYCLARGAPKGPNIPRAQLNHQGPLFPGHGYATHSQTWVGEPTWLGVRSDATHQAPTKVGAPCVRVWWPTWLGSVVTLLTKHLAPKVQAPPAELGVRGDATLQTPAFTVMNYEKRVRDESRGRRKSRTAKHLSRKTWNEPTTTTPLRRRHLLEDGKWVSREGMEADAAEAETSGRKLYADAGRRTPA